MLPRLLDDGGSAVTTIWDTLATRLRAAVARAGGPTAPQSGGLKIVFTSNGEVCVEIGGIDIDHWARHERIGTFDTEISALVATHDKVKEAESIALGTRGEA